MFKNHVIYYYIFYTFNVLEDCQDKQLTPDVRADEVLFVVVVVFSCSLSPSTLEL